MYLNAPYPTITASNPAVAYSRLAAAFTILPALNPLLGAA